MKDILAAAGKIEVDHEPNGGSVAGRWLNQSSGFQREDPLVERRPRDAKVPLHAGLAGATNDFKSPERLRKLAFSETVPAPKIPEQILLEHASGSEESGEDGDTPGPM